VSSALLATATTRTEAVRQALRRELKLSPLKQGEVSRQLGMGAGYLANLFTTLQGRKPIAVRLDLVLALLTLLNVRPSLFFAQLELREGWFGERAQPELPPNVEPPTNATSAPNLEQVGRLAVDLVRALAPSLEALVVSKRRRRRKALG
jgi:hypothetical protein